MYCNSCGKTIQDDASLCGYCGRAVGTPVARRLIRPRDGRQIAGVALAVARYLDLDVTLVRLVWVLLAVFGGCGIVAYLIGWVVIPSEAKLLPVQAMRHDVSAAG